MPRALAVRFELAAIFLLLVGLRIIAHFFDPYTASLLDYQFVSLFPSLYFLALDFTECFLISFVIFASGDHPAMFALRKLRFPSDFVWTVVAVGLISASTFLVYDVAFHDSGWSLRDELRPSFPERPIPTIVGTVGLFVSAFAQEFVYRGHLFARFTEVTGSVAGGVLLSSLSFASVHLYQGAVGLVSTFLFGVICCFVVIPTRSIWPVTFAHFLLNAYYYGLLG